MSDPGWPDPGGSARTAKRNMGFTDVSFAAQAFVDFDPPVIAW
ncbi:hypothetical protein [Streptomyces sp. AA1529]